MKIISRIVILTRGWEQGLEKAIADCLPIQEPEKVVKVKAEW